VDAVNGLVPLQSQQYDSSWRTHPRDDNLPADQRAAWRISRLANADTDFAEKFHLSWMVREGFDSAEVELAQLR
jgi:hypothetical protein